MVCPCFVAVVGGTELRRRHCALCAGCLLFPIGIVPLQLECRGGCPDQHSLGVLVLAWTTLIVTTLMIAVGFMTAMPVVQVMLTDAADNRIQGTTRLRSVSSPPLTPCFASVSHRRRVMVCCVRAIVRAAVKFSGIGLVAVVVAVHDQASPKVSRNRPRRCCAPSGPSPLARCSATSLISTARTGRLACWRWCMRCVASLWRPRWRFLQISC